jgi:hypothetical protein
MGKFPSGNFTFPKTPKNTSKLQEKLSAFKRENRNPGLEKQENS